MHAVRHDRRVCPSDAGARVMSVQSSKHDEPDLGQSQCRRGADTNRRERFVSSPSASRCPAGTARRSRLHRALRAVRTQTHSLPPRSSFSFPPAVSTALQTPPLSRRRSSRAPGRCPRHRRSAAPPAAWPRRRADRRTSNPMWPPLASRSGVRRCRIAGRSRYSSRWPTTALSMARTRPVAGVSSNA
jgi:hypothetical protein